MKKKIIYWNRFASLTLKWSLTFKSTTKKKKKRKNFPKQIILWLVWNWKGISLDREETEKQQKVEDNK